MPEVSIKTAADRALGDPQDMHPRLNGDLINTPDDLTEGKGNFTSVDARGNPEGFTLGQPPKIVSRDIYMGLRADTTTKQNQVPLSLKETSYLVNSPLIDGDPLPEFLTPSGLPKPPTPTLKKEKAPVAGYPASTLEKPYWIAYSWIRNGSHTALSSFTRVPPIGEGQVMSVAMPENAPIGATHIGIWLSRPGTSTASTPGPMSLQLEVRLSNFFGNEIELKGPYIYNNRAPIPSSANETQMQIPARPTYTFNSGRWASRPGSYYLRVSAVNSLGETLASSAVGPVTISASSYWQTYEPGWRSYFGLDPDADLPLAGYGYIRVFKPTLPQGATGWYLYVMVDSQWHRLYDKLNGHGLTSPIPVATSSVDILGWEGSEEWAFDIRWLLGSGEPPTENTTGIEPPDSPLEEPVISGASRPGAGTYYARVVDRSDEEQSPPSDWASITIANDEVMRVIPGNPANRLANATFVEKGADGLPLSYTITQTNGTVTLEGGELIMQTSGSQTGTTPTVLTDAVGVDVHKEWSVGALLELENPITGAFQGSFEAVLREISSAGGTTDTVLKSAGAIGEHRYYSVIASVDFPSGLTWQSNTVKAQILYRFAGSPKNMKVRISRQLLKDYAYGFRRRELVEGAPANPNPPAETTANPSGEVALEPSPTPETTPDAFTQTGPDRPLSSGTTVETANYDNELPPGWTSHTQNATLAREAGAAISGTQGMVSRKSSGGSAAYAYQDKTFSPDTGQDERNYLGDLTRHRFPTFPTNGSVTFKELRNGSGQKFAWVDFDNRFEVSRLTVNSAPTSSGNVMTTLDEGGTSTLRNTAVSATTEQSTLTIDNDPSNSGNVTVTLGGSSYNFPVQIGHPALPEVVEVEILTGATGMGRVAVYLASPWPNPRNTGTTSLIAVVNPGNSAETVANNIRGYANNWQWAYDWWNISGSGRKIIFTAKFAAPTVGTHGFNGAALISGRLGYGQTGVTARVTTLVKGGVAVPTDNNADVAGKIRSFSFPGYKTGGTSNTVTFEALEAGPRTDASYSDGGTGATSTAGMVTTQQGGGDSVDDVATKILATYSGNSYWSASRTGNEITFTALSTGLKNDATFSGGTTGTTGTMQTLIQGSPDIIAYATDSSGVIRKRRIIENVSTSTLVNIDLAVSGAGTPPSGSSRAVVHVWASTGSSTRTLRALFEDLDLAGYPAAVATRGVSGESASSLTWEVHTDDGETTDRGKSYYRYHDYSGELLNQLHGFFLPNQPVRDDLFLHGYRQAVLPDTQYTAGVYIRWNGVVGTQEPFYLYGVTADDALRPIGCITGGITGASSSGAWQHKQLTFTTDPDVYEIRLDSRRIGPGEMVAQELVDSVGGSVKRTLAYATSGSYTATLDIGTPNNPPMFYIPRVRTLLESDIEVPAGATAQIYYSSADSKAGPFSTPTLDPTAVPQKNILKVELSTTSNGLVTPVLKAESPKAEYLLGYIERPWKTLVRADRTEFLGGSLFGPLQPQAEYAEPPEVVTHRLPGGRFYKTVRFGPVGNQPSFEIMMFDPAGKKYLEDRAELQDIVLEAWGQIFTLRPNGPMRFKRTIRDIYEDGGRYNVYVATVPDAQVVDVRPLPQLTT